MSRLIDADALERDGWQMSRTVRINKDTMELQTRNPTDFPAIEPQRMRGKWVDRDTIPNYAKCSVCGFTEEWAYENNYCPNCGADMRGDSNG